MKLVWIIFIAFSLQGQTVPLELAKAAETLTLDDVTYDPTYYSIDYPMGDVPKGKGVCTDVVIRAYRKLGVDLQQLVHEDMKAYFGSYPKNWGLSKTDRNIDHRRVPNLMKFFERKGTSLSTRLDPNIYKPGDIVCWRLPGNLTHIGIVSSKKNAAGTNYMVVHNIGGGQVFEDILFDYSIIGHYRY